MTDDFEPSVGDELAARSMDLLTAVRALVLWPPEGATDAEILAGLRVLLRQPLTGQTDYDHVFVSRPYTKTCWYRLADCGGRCEHLAESSVHRGTDAYRQVHG